MILDAFENPLVQQTLQFIRSVADKRFHPPPVILTCQCPRKGPVNFTSSIRPALFNYIFLYILWTGKITISNESADPLDLLDCLRGFIQYIDHTVSLIDQIYLITVATNRNAVNIST